MRPKQTEIRAMTELLDAVHPDVEHLASRALQLAWELFDQRERWVLILEQPGVGTAAFGPANTRNEIAKQIGVTIFAAGPAEATGTITKLIPHTTS